jgi:hypothetical protein
LVAADLDSDGRIDAVATNSRDIPTVMRNQSASQGFLEIRLIGTSSNRDAVGAVVTLRQAGTRQVRHVLCGHSYQSDSGRLLHFGLPDSRAPASLEIVWPSGKKQLIDDVAVGQIATIVEASGK